MQLPHTSSLAAPRSTRGKGRLALLVTLLALPLASFAATSSAATSAESRYAFDPACPWGCISNGNGMLLRCITEPEARALNAGTTAPATPRPSDPAPTEPPTSSDAETASKPKKPVKVSIGRLDVEEGTMAVGALSKPLDRYASCVETNGGLNGSSAEVQVRFLVRGERGRAEAVEVARAKGVSKKAAQCIADVIDRRRTGAPSAPMTGATLTLKITQ